MRMLLALFLAVAVQTAECGAQNWELVKPDGLDFEIEFPKKPAFTETKDADGGTVRTFALNSNPADYDLTIWELPPGTPAPKPGDVSQILDGFRDSTLGKAHAKLRTETKIEIGGREAREVVADVRGLVWRARFVVAGNRMYQIYAIVPKEAEKLAEIDRLMASFKLTGVAAGDAKK